MPLTTTGKKIKRNFEKEYGKKKGDKIFYSWENKTKRKDIKIPSTKKIIKTGIALGTLGIGIKLIKGGLE